MLYTVMHACGHEEEVRLFGSTSNRERKVKWMETLPCAECEKKAEREAIEARNKELGLPDLQGTPKQVEWAMGIRLSQISSLEGRADELSKSIPSLEERFKRWKEEGREDGLDRLSGRISRTREDLSAIVKTIDGISAIDNSSWWIDNRDKNTDGLVEAYRTYQGIKMEEEIAEEAAPQMVVMEPEERKTDKVVFLTAIGGYVYAKSEKSEKIRTVLKANGFSWDGVRVAWGKKSTEMTGDVKDLLPDTARILIEHGIPVKAHRSVKDAVESGQYEPECHRWVRVSREGDRLVINTVSSVDKYPSGKWSWNDDWVFVNPTSWKEVREFAQINGYKITRKAEEMLKKAEEATVSIVLAKVKKETSGKEALAAILDSPRDVLEDLKDDDEED